MPNSTMQPIISPVGREFLRLHLVPDVGAILARRLLDYFGGPAEIFTASRAALQRVDKVGPKVADSIFKGVRSDRADVETDRAGKLGIRIVCIEDPDYPAPLKNINDPPICLFVRGHWEPQDAVAVAIVGTRRCSHYGREQAIRFGRALSAAGFTVVSGLARGIDGFAHRGALQGGGRTVAVLGGGLASIYPVEHESLADEIAAGRGALISEYAVDCAPVAGNFPQRNRIITGLSLGVLVVEAGRRSGACITARLASEYNRELFAIPGRIDQPEMTAGVNALIRDAQAKLITGIDDILDEFGEVGDIMRGAASAGSRDEHARGDGGEQVLGAGKPAPRPRLAPHEHAVYSSVVGGEESAERISNKTHLSMGQVTSTLTSLQLKGLVRCLPGSRFVPRKAGM
ncbi:MAG: DNA-processing protein DprA [Phycisphaerae bacterium]